MVIDRTQHDRQVAIVDILRSCPDLLAWHIISDLPIEVQNDLYDRLREFETEAS